MESNKILVTYASRFGATAGVAEAIGKTLAERGAQVDVLPMREVKDLAPYRAVVAGSAINGAAWLPDIKKIPSFSDRLKFQLSVLFGVWKEGDHRDWNAIRAWAESLYPLLNPGRSE